MAHFPSSHLFVKKDDMDIVYAMPLCFHSMRFDYEFDYFIMSSKRMLRTIYPCPFLDWIWSTSRVILRKRRRNKTHRKY